MFIYTKKSTETIDRKICGYESVINFYEKNRGGRFQSRKGLIRILNEIIVELDKDQTKNNLDKLSVLRDRIYRPSSK